MFIVLFQLCVKKTNVSAGKNLRRFQVKNYPNIYKFNFTITLLYLTYKLPFTSPENNFN